MRENDMNDQRKESLKQLPKIDELMIILKSRGIYKHASKDLVLRVCRETVEELRQAILAEKPFTLSEPEILARVQHKLSVLVSYRLKPVVNATGVILHTNLGRAPLCQEALENIIDVVRGYSNLEFDLEQGKRGSRYDHLRGILCELTGAEDAIVVNNNAAAVVLALNTISEGKEVIVSRGELIEIGGEFRIPDVMEKSQSVLHEVGTTNKTHLSDYERAIKDNTGLLFKAHTSNYKVIGFTGEVSLQELVSLGSRYGIPVMHDLGSGCFIELDRYGMEREPTVQDAVATGADVVTFSGDKLLGGPQAGIIVGRRNWIKKIAQNPLNRAFRIDKLTIAALEATLNLYAAGEEKAVNSIPALSALTESIATVEKRARKLLKRMIALKMEGFTFQRKMSFTMAGGGSLPGQEIPTVLISMKSNRMSPNRLESLLRGLDTPIIVRISDEEILFDLRTLTEGDFKTVLNGLQKISGLID